MYCIKNINIINEVLYSVYISIDSSIFAIIEIYLHILIFLQMLFYGSLCLVRL